MPGVRTAVIDFDAKEATVTYDPKKATFKAMDAALKKAGYSGSFKRWVDS